MKKGWRRSAQTQACDAWSRPPADQTAKTPMAYRWPAKPWHVRAPRAIQDWTRCAEPTHLERIAELPEDHRSGSFRSAAARAAERRALVSNRESTRGAKVGAYVRNHHQKSEEHRRLNKQYGVSRFSVFRQLISKQRDSQMNITQHKRTKATPPRVKH